MRGLVTIIVLVMLLLGVFMAGYTIGEQHEINENFYSRTPFKDVFGYSPDEVIEGSFVVTDVNEEAVTIEGHLETTDKGWEHLYYQATFADYSSVK